MNGPYQFRNGSRGVVTPVNQPIDGHSFMLIRMNIEPGQIVEISSDETKHDWFGGPFFRTSNFIYAGSSNLWILKKSHIGGTLLSGCDLLCDTFSGVTTSVRWPLFSYYQTGNDLKLFIENRAKESGNFIARLAGSYDENSGW